MPGRPSIPEILRPRSVALVGVSSNPLSLSRKILANIRGGGYAGAVHLVNTRQEVIDCQIVYPSVEAIPGPVDLAVIVVPADQVAPVLDQCGRKGVKGAVVISSGFREIGAAGMDREAALRDAVARNGLRLVGPNCMGVIAWDEDVRLNATFSTVQPLPGAIAMISQSGALGNILLERAREERLGISRFVSIGNKTDVTANDLLAAWAGDPCVDMVLMYLEDFGDMRAFVEAAHGVGESAPVVAVKAGRTLAGALAASFHTGAVVGPDDVVDAVLAQAGVIRAAGIEEMFNYAKGLRIRDRYRGDRVAVVTNAGGPAILATDALVTDGFAMASIGEETRAALKNLVPPEGTVGNPLDLLAAGTPDQFGLALDILLRDAGVDAGLVLYISPLYGDVARVATTLDSVARRHRKPVLTCMLGAQSLAPEVYPPGGLSYPIFHVPESAVKALAGIRAYHRWTRRDRGRVLTHAMDLGAVRSVIPVDGPGEETTLSYLESRRILEACGLSFPRSVTVSSAEEVTDKGAALRLPLVLKLSARGLEHKTEAGAVAVNIASLNDLLAAYQSLHARVDPALMARSDGVVVEEMVTGGTETLLGVRYDARYGPMVVFGLGGILVELLGDVVVRVPPITDVDAFEMVRSIRGWPLLEGYRGEAPRDVATAEKAIQRLSRLVEGGTGIGGVEINPLIIREEGRGAVCVDAKIRLRSPGRR